MIKAFIFDVDGTLVDSVDFHTRAWQRAFASIGRKIAFDDIRGQIGKGGDQLLPVFLTEDEIDRHGAAIDTRRAEILQNHYLAKIEGFPCVRALFDRLRQDGIRIGLASSAASEELAAYKRKADIEGLIEDATSSDDAERSKPHGDIFQAARDRLGVDPGDAIVVGDTPYDAEAAAKVGVRTIGVLSGGFHADALRSAGCVAIFDDPADMLARYDALLAAANG